MILALSPHCTPPRQILLPPLNRVHQGLIQIAQRLFPDIIRYAVCGLGDAAGDGGQGVAVPAQGDGVSDGVFKASAFEEGDDRLGHRLPAAFIEEVARADVIQGLALTKKHHDLYDSYASPWSQ